MRTVLLLCVAVSPASGYFHVPPQTLKDMCDGSDNIRVLTVKARDTDKGVVVLDLAEEIRVDDKSGIASFRLVARDGSPGSKEVLGKLTNGATAVLFSTESAAGGKPAGGFGYAFIDGEAFCVDYNAAGAYWLFVRGEPGLSKTYHGPAKDLPPLVKAILKGDKVKVPTKAPATKDDYGVRGLLVDEARRRNRPDYPTSPLPTAWGKPAKGLQAGLRINPAVLTPGAVSTLEVVIRNVGDKPIIFNHLQLAFGGDHEAGTVTARATEAVSEFVPAGTKLAVIVSPGDACVLAKLPVYRPGEEAKSTEPRLRLRIGENRVGAEGIKLWLGDEKDRPVIELSTGHLDVPVPGPKR